MLDKKSNLLEDSQSVNVPQPQGNDRHKNAFVGTIIDVLEDRGTAIVEDQCGNAFEIEAERLVIND